MYRRSSTVAAIFSKIPLTGPRVESQAPNQSTSATDAAARKLTDAATAFNHSDFSLFAVHRLRERVGWEARGGNFLAGQVRIETV